jgi:hypothetical protein
MDKQDDFLRQSQFSSPGRYVRLFDDLPEDVRGLSRVVQGLVIHYKSDELRRQKVPRRRMDEVNTRYVDLMLKRLLEMDGRPLSEPRPPSKRIIGCCRDFALLFTSMARHKGIPSRLRVGFANYFQDYPRSFWVDHTIGEYRSTAEDRWRLVDPEQSPALVKWNRLDFDPTDVPWGRFIVGGRAWQLCRNEGVDPSNFGVEPGQEPGGSWFVRSRLLLDLAALNRHEVLLWDGWDAVGPTAKIGPSGMTELDAIARNEVRDPPSMSLARRQYGSRRWKVPGTVWCFSPVGRPRKERLRASL